MLTRTLAAAPQEASGGTTMVQMMATVGVLLLCFTTLVLLRRRLRRQAHERGQSVSERIQSVREDAMRRSQRPSKASQQQSPRASAAARASVEAVMADAEELTRRLAAVMDNKAARLEILIQQANEAAERLERASGSDGAPRPAPSPIQPTAMDPLTAEVYALADQGKASLEIARELDEPTGKVELILALRPPKTSATASN